MDIFTTSVALGSSIFIFGQSGRNIFEEHETYAKPCRFTQLDYRTSNIVRRAFIPFGHGLLRCIALIIIGSHDACG